MTADQGFSLIEMMVATAISLVVLGTVMTAVVEGERSINTIAARTADSNAAQPYMNQMALDTRGATEVSVLCPTGSGSGWSSCTNSGSGEVTGSMLLTYHVGTSAALQRLYLRSVVLQWFGPRVQQLGRRDGRRDDAADAEQRHRRVATGVQSGRFRYFQAYTGLVDISVSVLNAGTATGSESQQASSPSALETEVDNAYSVKSAPPEQC